MKDTNSKTHCYSDMILEHMPVGIALYAAEDLCLLEANSLFLTFLDTFLPVERRHISALGRSIRNWNVNEQSPAVVEIFQHVAETGISYRGDEFAIYTATGDLTYWNWTLDAIRDAEGRITHLLQTSSEITTQVLARQRAEQAQSVLREAKKVVEAEYHWLEVVETVARSVRTSLDTRHIGNVAVDALHAHFQPLSVCIHTAHPLLNTLRLLCVRTSLAYGHGSEALQAIPYTSSSLISLALGRQDPLIIEDLQEAALQGRVEQNHPLVCNGVRGFISVPLWFGDQFEGTLTAIFPASIQAQGMEARAFAACGTHIAAALAQARLHSVVAYEQLRLRTILDQLPEGILLIDAVTSCVSYGNPAASALLALPLPELIDVPIHQHPWLSPPQDADAKSRAVLPWNFCIIRALAGETIRSQETVVHRRDGSTCFFLTSSAPLYTASGIISGAMIVFQDVTAQKSLEQQKNEFFSMANHELRTPITIIQGFAELLQLAHEQNPQLSPFAQTSLTTIVEESTRLTNLIEEMLDLSCIESCQFKLQYGSHDLLQVVRQVINNHAITTRKHHIHLVLEGLAAEDTLPGHFDKKRMIQVISNLMSNAIKYSPDGGDITIGLSLAAKRPDQVVLRVKDQGIGIAESDLPHVFKRFHRASTLDPAISGLGIGLSMAREIVTRHGGHIWVESEPGKGSTFYVALPLSGQKSE